MSKKIIRRHDCDHEHLCPKCLCASMLCQNAKLPKGEKINQKKPFEFCDRADFVLCPECLNQEVSKEFPGIAKLLGRNPETGKKNL